MCDSLSADSHGWEAGIITGVLRMLWDRLRAQCEGLREVDQTIGSQSDRIALHVKLRPLRPFTALCNLVVNQAGAGRWRFDVKMEVSEPEAPSPGERCPKGQLVVAGRRLDRDRVAAEQVRVRGLSPHECHRGLRRIRGLLCGGLRVPAFFFVEVLTLF